MAHLIRVLAAAYIRELGENESAGRELSVATGELPLGTG
jgi:hypothetical protein